MAPAARKAVVLCEDTMTFLAPVGASGIVIDLYIYISAVDARLFGEEVWDMWWRVSAMH